MSSRRIVIVILLSVAFVVGHCVTIPAHAFCPLTSRWPGGQVTMSQNLPATDQLINGTTSWAQNAESAMQEWSDVSSAFRFINGGSSGVGENNRDDVNNMLFGDSAGGDPFEEDVLALTLTRSLSDGTALESDIVFNRSAKWNAYDGPIRIDASGAPVFDFRRVVLHELGHVLGLGHPDESCDESVDSVMNAQTTSTDGLTADDRNGLSFVYAGGNQPPVADAGPDQQGDGTQPFVLNGGRSRDTDGVIVSYDWELGGELIARGRVSEIPLRRGTYEFRLTVTDEDGASSFDTMTIFVGSEFTPPSDGNERPVADAGGDRTTRSGTAVLLDGSASFDPDGVIDRFLWTMGNAVLGREAEIRLSLSEGRHLITLVVFDSAGDTDSDSIVVNVEPGATEPSDVENPPADDPLPGEEPPVVPAIPCGPLGAIPVLAVFGFYPFLKTRLASDGARRRCSLHV